MFTPTPPKFEITVFENRRDNRGTPYTVNWRKFAERLQKKATRLCKDGKAFAPTRFAGNGIRSKDNVTDISMLVLDIDNGMSLSKATEIWEALGVKFLIYTSFSHQRVTERHPKAEDCFRIVAPLLQPIPKDQFYLLRKWANQLMLGNVDMQTNDPSRMYYLPAVVSQDATFFAYNFKEFCNCGYDFDYDHIPNEPHYEIKNYLDWALLDLEKFEEKSITSKATKATEVKAYAPSSIAMETNSSAAYAEVALKNEINVLLTASVGSRNAQLNKSAYSLGQLIASGLLDESTVTAELYTAARAIGLQDYEIFPTIQSGLKSGLSSPRNVQLKQPKPALPAFSKAPWKLDPDIEKEWLKFSTSKTTEKKKAVNFSNDTSLVAIKSFFSNVTKLKKSAIRNLDKEDCLNRMMDIRNWLSFNKDVEIIKSVDYMGFISFIDCFFGEMKKSFSYELLAIFLHLESFIITNLGARLVAGNCLVCGYPTPYFVRNIADGLCTQCRKKVKLKTDEIVRVEINKVNLFTDELSDEFPIFVYKIIAA